MKERPILFSAPMVLALLDGSKTQTRRVVNTRALALLDAAAQLGECHHLGAVEPPHVNDMAFYVQFCPYGQPEDRLWVREAWSANCPEVRYRADKSAVYFGDTPHRPELLRLYDRQRGDWRPGIHMPRWASRINLEIVSVRVERLQDISEADALAEGIGLNANAIGVLTTEEDPQPLSIAAYRLLWESINGPGSWDANPWVWVVEFKRVMS